MDTLSIWCVGGLCAIGLSADVIILFIIILFVKSFQQYRWYRSKPCACFATKINKLIIVSLLTMIMSLVYVLIDWYRIYYSLEMKYQYIDRWHKGLMVLNDVFYYIATVLLYIALIMRVYLLFQDTIYALSRKQILFLIGVITFDVFAIGLFVFSIYTAVASVESNIMGSDTIRLALSGITVVINDFAINFFVLYLFLNKLYQMVSHLGSQYQGIIIKYSDINDTKSVKIRQKYKNAKLSSDLSGDRDDYNYDNCSITDADVDELEQANQSDISGMSGLRELYKNENEQNDLVNLMTKISLLTIISIVFEQFYTMEAAYNVYQLVINGKSTKSDDIWFSERVVLGYGFRAIEAILNCAILYFAFIFNNKEYMCIFHCCHKCLKNICIECIKRKQIDLIQNEKIQKKTQHSLIN